MACDNKTVVITMNTNESFLADAVRRELEMTDIDDLLNIIDDTEAIEDWFELPIYMISDNHKGDLIEHFDNVLYEYARENLV